MHKKVVFISDIHLRSSDEPNAKLLLRFLDHLEMSGCTHLFLLGDIFDLWIANHTYFVNRFAPILEKLSRLRTRGVEIHYFEGNHDLDLRPYFERTLHFIVHENAYLAEFDGVRVRIEHGDQMDPTDRDYLFLRWLLRTRLMRWLGRRLPGRVVNWIGESASRKSRSYTSTVHRRLGTDEVSKKLLAHASRVFSDKPFHILIAGHVHIVMDRSLQDGQSVRVINLGTWLDVPMAFELSLSTARLIPILTLIAPPN